MRHRSVASGTIPRMRTKLLAPPLVAILVACTPEDRETTTIAGTPVEIEPSPKLSVGEAFGADAEQLDRVGEPSRLPDGSLVVPLQRVGEIRIFGPDGEYIRSYGGRGGGPGEFQHLSGVWVRGDTIEAWDGSPPRITRFFPDGSLKTVLFRYEGPLLSSLVGGLSEGWLINAVTLAGVGVRDQMVVHRFDTDGTHSGEGIVESLGMERVLMGNFSGPHPLSPAARFAFHSDAASEELYVAETLTPAIEVFDPSGTLKRTITWEPARVSDPDKAFDRIVRVAEEDAGEDPSRSRGFVYQPEWIRLTSPPDQVPAFSDFMVDEEGFIWIKPFEPARDAAALGGNVGTGRATSGGEWTILSPEGMEVGSVEVPAGLAPYQITSNDVLGVYRDEFGVEYVRVHSLKRI